MRRTTLLVFITGLLFACSPENTQNKTTAVATDFKELDTAVFFAGMYINELYYNSVRKTKSARESQEVAVESCITLPAKTLQHAIMVYDFHDGGENWAVVKNGGNYELWTEDLREKRRDIKIISKDKIKIGDSYFININSGDNVVNNAGPAILEQILFKGKYLTENGNVVELKANGEVKGLDHFNFYNPTIDYMGPALNIDQVAFGQTQEKTDSSFAYKWEGDTLLIYRLKCADFDSTNEMCGVVDFGELVYKLRKTN